MCVNMPKTIKEERLRWILPIYNKEIKLVDAVKVCPYSKRSLERWLGEYRKHGEPGLEPKSTRPKTNPRELITKDMFNRKLKEYKEKQAELNKEMQRYTDADENYYLTANIMLNLAKKAYEVFESSEIPEKRQLLNFLLQNLKLQGKKLSFELKTPFDTVLQANRCPTLLLVLDVFRTLDWVRIREKLTKITFI